MAISAAVPPQVMHATSKLKAAPPPSCTHTFDAWRTFAFSYSAQQSVSGRYGVDFRFTPEPTEKERRTLRLLDSVARGLGPKVLKRAAVQFDYVENANARAQINFPCALPGAHVPPSKSSQPSSQPLTQPGLQQTISTSSSATPRASPEHERFQAERAYQQQQDPFTDVFNFDLASPSEASAPPDTDVEPENDTEGTDTESERELRLSDLEGPIALRRRGRGGRRVRAGSTSNSASSGPGISPVSPGIMRPNASAPYVRTMNTNITSTSSLRPVYARRTSDVSPSTQMFSQTQLPGGIPSFSTAVSETGVGIVGPGAGGSTSPNEGGSSIGLSAAARARMRGRGVGAPISESDPDITPTNTAGVATVPIGGSMESRGAYDIGQYGYRHHAHPQYPGSASEASTAHTQARTGAFPTTIAFSAAKEGATPSQSHSSIQASNAGMNRQWQTTSSTTATAGDYGMGNNMDIDLDMGGWGRISDPLPMDLCYGIGGMSYSSPYAGQPETQMQSQTAGTYQNQAYSQQQRQYSQSHQQQNGLAGAQLSYYTSATTASTSHPVSSVNPSLNMSPTKWKGNIAGSPPSVVVGRQRAVSQSHVQGHAHRAGYWPTSDLRREM